MTVVLLLAACSFTCSSCYKEFDPSSYAPPFVISGYSSSSAIASTNLVGYWSFDDNVTDSVSGSAGTNSGASYITGIKGKALSLSAASKAYVTAPASAAITGLQSFTVSYWVNPVFTDADSDGSIDGILGLVNLSNTISFWGNIDWFVENGSTATSTIVKAHVTSGATDTWITVPTLSNFFGTWSNHTLTYDAVTSTFTYYINGSKVTTATASWTGNIAFTNSGPLVFGTVHFQTTPSLTSNTTAQTWASYLTGALDEVRIYNTALTATELNALVVLQGKGK